MVERFDSRAPSKRSICALFFPRADNQVTMSDTGSDTDVYEYEDPTKVTEPTLQDIMEEASDDWTEESDTNVEMTEIKEEAPLKQKPKKKKLFEGKQLKDLQQLEAKPEAFKRSNKKKQQQKKKVGKRKGDKERRSDVLEQLEKIKREEVVEAEKEITVNPIQDALQQIQDVKTEESLTVNPTQDALQQIQVVVAEKEITVNPTQDALQQIQVVKSEESQVPGPVKKISDVAATEVEDSYMAIAEQFGRKRPREPEVEEPPPKREPLKTKGDIPYVKQTPVHVIEESNVDFFYRTRHLVCVLRRTLGFVRFAEQDDGHTKYDIGTREVYHPYFRRPDENTKNRLVKRMGLKTLCMKQPSLVVER